MSNRRKSNKTPDEIIQELRDALKEAIDVFDRPTHQIDASFPEFSAMRRMKEALQVFDMKNIKIRTEANRAAKLIKTNKDLRSQLVDQQRQL